MPIRVVTNPADLPSLAEVHVRVTQQAVRAIICEPLAAPGGDSSDVLALLESVMVGVMNTMRSYGRDPKADMEQLHASVLARLPPPKVPTVHGLYGNA